MASHLVNKVVLDFSFSTEEKDTALPTTKQLFYEKILPRLSAYFDSVDQQLHISKFEIDLGQTTADNFENDFSKAFAKSFEVYKPLLKYPITPSSASMEEGDFSIHHLMHYLEKGYWPWNFQQKTEKEIVSVIVSFFETEMNLFNLFHNLESKPIPAERLIQLAFEHARCRESLVHSLVKYHPVLQSVLSFLPTAWKTKALHSKNFHFIFIRELFTSSPLHNEEEMINFLKQITEPLSFLAVLNKEGIENKKKFSKVENTMAALKIFFSFIETEYSKSMDKQDSLNEAIEKNNKDETNFWEERDTEKITIANAGLILFHPYLLHVFRDLNWVNADRKFVNKKVQQKAVIFLQYLVTGKSRHAEHLLVLNKILCNWPIHLPLQTAFNFSSKERAAANDLVESLREHWPVMKNTSNRGLVESFVKRPALLQKNSNGFLLQVEKKTIDILMDTLPFGINTIKLPWNEYLIYTEW